jgi:2-hydroxychromene-2-carboxylate isomerase
MTEPRIVTVYSDYKSPYAYLAKDLAYALEGEVGCRIDWQPYTLDIPSFLGSAEVDAQGQVLRAERNAHQWRRVRYSYMDCRRQAQRRGLTIRGPQKIWNSSLAAIGMLFAKRQAATVLRGYHDRVFERFWKRELDIEDPAVVTAVLAEAGADTTGLAGYLDGDGDRERLSIQRAAEESGVFGVPTFVIDGELYWGSEHLPDIRERLRAGR